MNGDKVGLPLARPSEQAADSQVINVERPRPTVKIVDCLDEHRGSSTMPALMFQASSPVRYT